MKKFISMLAAITMLAALFVAPVNAATSANPVVNIYAEAYDGTDAPANYKPGDYDVYKVWYTTAGVDTAEDMVTALQIKFAVSDGTKVASKSWLASKTSGPAAQKDANGVYSQKVAPLLISSGYYAWGAVDGVDAFDWDTYPDGGTQETLPYITTLIYVTAGETVTFTYSTTETKLVVDDYTNTNERTYTTDLVLNVNGVAGNVVTLGAVAPTTYTYTFKNADGTADISSADIEEGATVTAPTAPTVAGKDFVGWATSVGGAVVAVDSTAKADTTYYAVYEDSAPAYVEIPADTTQAQKVADPAAKTYKDYDNNDVTLTKSYAIARFVTAINPAKTYQLHAEATSGSKDFDMNFAGIEVSGTANFITIVKNAPDGTVLTIREQ
jgi:hypothetical protein